MKPNKNNDHYSSPDISLVEKLAADLITLNMKLDEKNTSYKNRNPQDYISYLI